MPLSGLIASLDAALASLEVVTGESITIGSVTCNCTSSVEPEDEQTFEAGGTVYKQTAGVNVRKSLLNISGFFLDVGLGVTFRGTSYRILAIHDSAAYWKIDLLQQEA